MVIREEERAPSPKDRIYVGFTEESHVTGSQGPCYFSFLGWDKTLWASDTCVLVSRMLLWSRVSAVSITRFPGAKARPFLLGPLVAYPLLHTQAICIQLPQEEHGAYHRNARMWTKEGSCHQISKWDRKEIIYYTVFKNQVWDSVQPSLKAKPLLQLISPSE